MVKLRPRASKTFKSGHLSTKQVLLTRDICLQISDYVKKDDRQDPRFGLLKDLLSEALELLPNDETSKVAPNNGISTTTRLINILPSSSIQVGNQDNQTFTYGEAVEARNTETSTWEHATVHCQIGDQVTVIFETTGHTQHCSPADLRRRERTEAGGKASKPFSTMIGTIEAVDIVIPNVTPRQPRRAEVQQKKTRAEYMAEKEKEQSEKQSAWLQFAKKLKR
jgi:hypothetical protein